MKPHMHRPHLRLREYTDALRHGSVSQIFAVVAGVVLTALGVLSLVVNADFGTGSSLAAERTLLFDVNGWSGIVHLVSGLALLYFALDTVRIRTVALAMGGLYVVLTVWSLIDSSILGLLPVNDPTAVMYAAIGVIGIASVMQSDEG